MPKRKRYEHERRPDGEREDSGDDPRRHARIITRRWLGSAPPTPERYARAIQQWHALPGAVISPATDVQPEPEAPAPAGSSPAPEEDGEKGDQ